MDFFKITLILATIACCFFYIKAGGLEAYDSISEDDLKKMCEQNGRNLADGQKTIWDNFIGNLKPESADESLKSCAEGLDESMTIELLAQMKEVKKCLKGSKISLSDKDVEKLVKRSNEKLCALLRLANYEQSIAESCLDYVEIANCENNVKEIAHASPENEDEYSNVGLTYSEKGKSISYGILDCTSRAVKEKCEPGEIKVHELLTKRYKKTFHSRD